MAWKNEAKCLMIAGLFINNLTRPSGELRKLSRFYGVKKRQFTTQLFVALRVQIIPYLMIFKLRR